MFNQNAKRTPNENENIECSISMGTIYDSTLFIVSSKIIDMTPIKIYPIKNLYLYLKKVKFISS